MNAFKKYNCLIVDDEPPAREVIRRFVEQMPILELAGECGNSLQAITVLKSKPIDIIFLDIQMPQVSGLELITTLKQPPKIILTTAFEQYAVKAFELDVTDYLVKPIRFERFLKAVMKALPEHEVSPSKQIVPSSAPAFLYFRTDRKMVKVLLSEIHYIESLKDYVKIRTSRGDVVTKHSMSALEAMLPADTFIRVHRSFIIALPMVNSFTQEEIEIQKVQIPIGKLYRQQALKSLTA